MMSENEWMCLTISAVSIPDKTGPEMAAMLRHSHPDIPFLCVTGFAGDIDDAAKFAGCEVLRKHYTMSALSAALDHALAERATGINGSPPRNTVGQAGQVPQPAASGAHLVASHSPFPRPGLSSRHARRSRPQL